MRKDSQMILLMKSGKLADRVDSLLSTVAALHEAVLFVISTWPKLIRQNTITPLYYVIRTIDDCLSADFNTFKTVIHTRLMNDITNANNLLNADKKKN